MGLSGTEGILFFSAIALVLVCAFVIYRRRWNKRIKRLLLSHWGEESDRTIAAGEIAAIRGQASVLAGDAGFCVDDITWNDLDMDKLYTRVNATYTDAGDGVLYGMLRNPLLEASELRRRGRIMAWAKADADNREKVKWILYNLGRTGAIDLTAMFEKDWFSRRRWAGCIALSASFAASVALSLLGVGIALFPMMALAVTNLVVHLRSRKLTQKYFAIFQYVPSVLNAAGKMAALRIPELEETSIRIRERIGNIKGILNNSLLKNYYSFNMRSASNPLDVLLATFNVFFLIDLISLYNLSRHVFRYKREILEIFTLLGEVDSLIAAASCRETLPKWCEPEFEEAGGGSVRFDGLVHPLLRDPVPNSAGIHGNMLLTGSNATGKSTFLKAVALNAILAQSLHTCAANSWRSGFFRVYTSMALRDDLFSNESYFITEIKSLKRMLDSFKPDSPSLCIVDEVLRGTNTGERIAAASEALMRFSENNCLCLAATHDIELTYILDGVFENMHFSEKIIEGGIHFDYIIRPGRSRSRNAIKLLELLGYGKELVDAANSRLESFEKTGKWQRVQEGAGG